MATFENPDVRDIALDDVGTIFEAARAADVKPGTIRVWESRGKIVRLPLAGLEPLYHLPTIEAAAKVPAGRPARAA